MKTFVTPLLAAALAWVIFQAPAQAQSLEQHASGDLMAVMAPMVGMMKNKIGNRRFARMIRVVGPMAAGMMSNGGFNGGGGAPNFDMIGTGIPGGAPIATDNEMVMNGGGYGIGGISGMPGLDQIMSGGMIQSLIGMGMSHRGHRGHRRHRAAT